MIPIDCPTCHSSTELPFCELRDHAGTETFRAVHCRTCDLVFLNPAPSPEDMERYYANARGEEMRAEPGALFRAMQRLSFSRETRPLRRLLSLGDTVLDVGAGDGAMARYLLASGYQAGAVDFYPPASWSPGSAIPYRDLDLHGGRFTAQDISSVLRQPPRAVIMRHVLEHLLNPKAVLATLRAASAEYLYIVVPNRDSVFARMFGQAWYYWDPPRHVNFFNRRSLARLLDSAGYDVVAHGHYGIDEIVTSIHRKLALGGRGSGPLARLTSPKGLLAGISSALSSPLLHTVCWSVSRARR